MRVLLSSFALLLVSLPASVFAQAGGGFGGTSGATSPAAGTAGTTSSAAVTDALGTPGGPTATGVPHSSLPAAAQTFGKPYTLQTLQGPGAVASATNGTIGAPGIVGGFFGVGQSQLVPTQGPVTGRQNVLSGVDMPLTGGNARGGMGAGAAGRAAQSYFNPAPFAAGRNEATTQSAQSQTAGVEGWRFRRHDDLWWYYKPQRTWAVRQGNRWVAYQRGALYARDTMPRPAENQVTAGYRPAYLGTGMYSGQR